MNTGPLLSEKGPERPAAFDGRLRISMSRNRRVPARVQMKRVYEFDSYRLDPAGRLLLKRGERITIPPKAFDLLAALIESGGRVLGKDELMQMIWPDTYVEQANLAVTISLARKVLGMRPEGGQYIETMPRRGYRFAAPVKEVSDAGFDGPVSGAGIFQSPVDEAEEFLTVDHQHLIRDRVLATVMVACINEFRMTDGASDILYRLQAQIGKEIELFHGRVVEMSGDRIMATFDGPARAIRCASVINEVARRLGIRTRVGLHTGECDVIGGRVGGTAVEIGAQLASRAATGEVLVSRTVKDLVAGSGFRFAGRGVYSFDEATEEWELFAVQRMCGS